MGKNKRKVPKKGRKMSLPPNAVTASIERQHSSGHSSLLTEAERMCVQCAIIAHGTTGSRGRDGGTLGV
ncbi:hypothetical protein K438DRAFT_1983187 [Mycena galopus ATCC 62051]|nr:hypothetical protein K438DRAFT_1983187 [Mycena galopus ATCC 62051]